MGFQMTVAKRKETSLVKMSIGNFLLRRLQETSISLAFPAITTSNLCNSWKTAVSRPGAASPRAAKSLSILQPACVRDSNKSHFRNAETISLLPQGAIVVNTARRSHPG
jgi:hypothetical protein